MKDFHTPFAALLQGSLPAPVALRFQTPELEPWEGAGDATWARVLSGQRVTRFRPRWLPTELIRATAPARLPVTGPALRPGTWQGAPRLRRPALLASSAS